MRDASPPAARARRKSLGGEAEGFGFGLGLGLGLGVGVGVGLGLGFRRKSLGGGQAASEAGSGRSWKKGRTTS